MNLDSAFNPFLYASVGDDANGMSLSVLSAFARQDVDPWEQAATLSRLPVESARTKLVAMLGALPGHPSLADRNDIAGRLIRLLPQDRAADASVGGNLHRILLGGAAPERKELRIVLFYVTLMILGLWVFSGVSPTPPEGSAADNGAPATQATGSAQSRQP